MSMNRREFLKIAGLSTIVGIGGVTGVTALKNSVEASQVATSPEALTAKRWAMVVDLSKFSDEDIQVADACHREHNVPM